MEPQLKPIPIDNSRPTWSPTQGFGRTDLPGVATGDQNKVLRNTYWLLALSMLPDDRRRAASACRSTSPRSTRRRRSWPRC